MALKRKRNTTRPKTSEGPMKKRINSDYINTNLKRSVNSSFGQLKDLSINQNRQLLLGGGQAAPGNAGKYLSNREKTDLQACLDVDKIYVISQDEFVKEYIRKMGKKPKMYSREMENKKCKLDPCV